ncbi:MAG: hypothetical protein ACJ789_13885 [Thermomicrobiales bacterium]
MLFAGLAIWAAARMDAFHWFASVTLPNGDLVRMPVGYASVDHPFHATRAETLQRSLADREILRWIGNHQGGYPSEFYPLGVAWLEFGLWGLLLGSLPIVVVHKLTIVLIFLLPGLAYFFCCRRDKLTPGIALLALAGQVAIGGWWWSGGYMELAVWGLVTNVAANVSLLFVLPALTGYLKDGTRRGAATAAIFSAFAIVTNPRSLIALATICVGVSLAVVLARDRPAVRDIVYRLGTVLAIAGLLAAPELISLMRFSNLYYFVHYSGYDSLRDFWHSSIQAVSGPIFCLGIVGLVSALATPGRTLTRAIAITLTVYVLITGYLSTDAAAKSLVKQLETTRLMPFQRYLLMYLAAIGAYDALRWSIGRASHLVVEGSLVGLAGVLLYLYVVSPPGLIPDTDRGLYKLSSTARPELAELRQAVKAADAAAPPGTALLVLGTNVSWHDGLWSPMWSDRPFFYDDWLWYWQTRNYGDYNPTTEHAYTRDDSTINHDYFEHHGIGAVVVTGEASTAAAASPLLESISKGTYNVYVVRDPTTIVTFDGQNARTSQIGNEEISANGEGAAGMVTVRRNWFPRWSATVNGKPAPISQTKDGYMTIPISDGDTAVNLRYVVDRWDWVARGMSFAGFAVVVVTLLPRRWFGTLSGQLGT